MDCGSASLARAARTVARWLPAVAYVAANWYVSSLPQERIGSLPAPDWLLHATANLAFGAALRLGTGEGRGALARAGALLAAHAAVDEWHQSWVPGRSSSLSDWVADVTGGLVGAVAVGWWWRLRRHGRRRAAAVLPAHEDLPGKPDS